RGTLPAAWRWSAGGVECRTVDLGHAVRRGRSPRSRRLPPELAGGAGEIHGRRSRTGRPGGAVGSAFETAPFARARRHSRVLPPWGRGLPTRRWRRPTEIHPARWSDFGD